MLPVVLAAMGFLYIGYMDFQTLKIRNRDVAILTALFFIGSALNEFHGLKSDMIAGSVLFALGFLFWSLKLMGGGDAKLLLPAGLFVGWAGLGGFAVSLLLLSVVILVILRSGLAAHGRSAFAQRMQMFRETSKIPYGVPIGLAAIISMNF